MAGLTSLKIKDSYKSLLRVNDSTNGVDSSLEVIEDGEGTDTPIKISTEKIEIIPPNTDSTTMFEVSDNGGTSLLTVDSTNDQVIIRKAKVLGNFACNGKIPASMQDYTVTNEVANRTYDANAASVSILADVLGTLINDLIAIGLLNDGSA
jgi:hypothetical protein